MLIHKLSDIHLEFGKFRHVAPDCDVVILSGDIGKGKMAIPWIENTFKGIPVVYVAGNHEHYGRVMRDNYAELKERADNASTEIHFLQNDSVVIQNVRFIGATLWTDFNLFGTMPMSIMSARSDMADYDTIQVADRVALTPDDVLAEHMASRYYIVNELAKPFEGKSVVVTHHAPSTLSIAEHFKFDPLTPCYASRLEDIMLDYNPVLWTHGHVHDNMDYEIGDTRVVCNPRGYVGHHLNKDFDPKLVIEI